MKNQNWKKYAYEFLSILFAVILAFSLNNWNDNRRERRAGNKILAEIHHGLSKDIDDVRENLAGHKAGLRSCAFWLAALSGGEVDLNRDSLNMHYFALTRDFIAIQNRSGYETLKSRGLELIESDSLRTEVVSIYEYDYEVIIKLEEEYEEAQFHKNYFQELNKLISPNLNFDERGQIVGMKQPIKLSQKERELLNSYLWKIRSNRFFIMLAYRDMEKKIIKLRDDIGKELIL